LEDSTLTIRGRSTWSSVIGFTTEEGGASFTKVRTTAAVARV
jgi:hypothetical protein